MTLFCFRDEGLTTSRGGAGPHPRPTHQQIATAGHAGRLIARHVQRRRSAGESGGGGVAPRCCFSPIEKTHTVQQKNTCLKQMWASTRNHHTQPHKSTAQKTTARNQPQPPTQRHNQQHSAPPTFASNKMRATVRPCDHTLRNHEAIISICATSKI